MRVKLNIVSMLVSLAAFLIVGCNSEPRTEVVELSTSTPTTMTTQEMTINGRFTPPDGKILLTIGQDADSIDDYIEASGKALLSVRARITSIRLKHGIPATSTLIG